MNRFGAVPGHGLGVHVGVIHHPAVRGLDHPRLQTRDQATARILEIGPVGEIRRHPASSSLLRYGSTLGNVTSWASHPNQVISTLQSVGSGGPATPTCAGTPPGEGSRSRSSRHLPARRILREVATPLLGRTQQPLFPFGHGPSYGRFDYTNLTVDQPTTTSDGSVTVTVEVATPQIARPTRSSSSTSTSATAPRHARHARSRGPHGCLPGGQNCHQASVPRLRPVSEPSPVWGTRRPTPQTAQESLTF
jgi:hypothetical protein